MASSPQSFQKRQREIAKKERAAAKRARRHARNSDDDAADDEGPSEDELLEKFRVLNERHAAGEIEAEDFEERKAEIFEQLGLGEA